MGNLFDSIQNLFGVIGDFLELPALLVSFLPDVLGISVLIVVALGIIKLVLGRCHMNVFDLFIDFYVDIFGLLSRPVFEMGGVSVSIGSLIFIAVVLNIVVAVFWKGARG